MTFLLFTAVDVAALKYGPMKQTLFLWFGIFDELFQTDCWQCCGSALNVAESRKAYLYGFSDIIAFPRMPAAVYFYWDFVDKYKYHITSFDSRMGNIYKCTVVIYL